MVTNIGGLPVRENVIVTIAGEVVALHKDEFLLRDSTGEIWVEPKKEIRKGLNLRIGDRVTVVGDRDDLEDFDAISVTVTNSAGNSQVSAPPPAPAPITNVSMNGVQNIGGLPVRENVIVTIAGEVVALHKDEFLLRDSTGEIWVEPKKEIRKGLNLRIGDRVTVVGDRDDLEDFDAISVTVTNSAGNSQVSAPPPAPAPITNVSMNGVQNIGGLPVRENVIITIAGEVVALHKDEFLLRDSTGEIWVEPKKCGSWNGLNLKIGERVTVVGDRDDLEDFDALSITRTNSPVNLPFCWENQNLTNGILGTATLGDDLIFGDEINANTINGNDGNDKIFGGENNDILSGNCGLDFLVGGGGNDIIFGGKDNDTITGNRGQDLIFGNLGDDILFGGKDTDFLDGGEGNDILIGDIEQDFLTGGPGNDVFVLSAAVTDLAKSDRILDFEIGFDRIQLSPGLTFADLSLEATNIGTVIKVSQCNQVLGIVDSVTPEMLTANNFLA